MPTIEETPRFTVTTSDGTKKTFNSRAAAEAYGLREQYADEIDAFVAADGPYKRGQETKVRNTVLRAFVWRDKHANVQAVESMGDAEDLTLFDGLPA